MFDQVIIQKETSNSKYMFEAIDRFEKLTWRQLVEIIEQQHAGTVIE